MPPSEVAIPETNQRKLRLGIPDNIVIRTLYTGLLLDTLSPWTITLIASITITRKRSRSERNYQDRVRKIAIGIRKLLFLHVYRLNLGNGSNARYPVLDTAAQCRRALSKTLRVLSFSNPGLSCVMVSPISSYSDKCCCASNT